LLNSRYKRGAKVDRCKDNGDLEAFEVYCPKAFAGIDARALVDTLLSRSIRIRMEKKVSAEAVDLWIAPLVEPEAIRLRERCEAWAAQHVEALTNHHPDLLGLINRQAEVWWALLSIAEHAGANWTGRARHAAKQLTTGGDDTDDVSAQVQILLDIKNAFGTKQTAFTKSPARGAAGPGGPGRAAPSPDPQGPRRRRGRNQAARPRRAAFGGDRRVRRQGQRYSVDRQDERFARRAFDAAIAQLRAEARAVPVLYGHDQRSTTAIIGHVPPDGWEATDQGLISRRAGSTPPPASAATSTGCSRGVRCPGASASPSSAPARPVAVCACSKR
jgi:hypothetical protein